MVVNEVVDKEVDKGVIKVVEKVNKMDVEVIMKLTVVIEMMWCWTWRLT